MDWIAVPEPVTWKLPKPGMSGGLQYDTLTVGAPTSANVLKASAVHGASGLDITLRMIEATSAENVPYEVLAQQPHWFNQQVADYFEEFTGTPAPDPLGKWRTERRKAALVQAAAEALEAEATAKAAAIAAALLAAAAPPS